MARRRIDIVLAGFYALFAVGWMLSDLPKALGVDTAINRYYAEAIDPAFAHLPALLDGVMKVAGIVYGPAYIAVVYGLVREKRWLPVIAVPLAVAMMVTTIVYLVGDLKG